jgi:hypothetical protein
MLFRTIAHRAGLRTDQLGHGHIEHTGEFGQRPQPLDWPLPALDLRQPVLGAHDEVRQLHLR